MTIKGLVRSAACMAVMMSPIAGSAVARAEGVYPERAAKLGLSGDVVLDCAAGADGKLTGCVVVSETPGGYGFREAASAIAPTLQLPPGGDPSRRVKVPIAFEPPPATPLTPQQADWRARLVSRGWHAATGANDLRNFWKPADKLGPGVYFLRTEFQAPRTFYQTSSTSSVLETVSMNCADHSITIRDRVLFPENNNGGSGVIDTPMSPESRPVRPGTAEYGLSAAVCPG